MKLTISQTANLTGISVRTLHYYDKIGLLHPSYVAASGYRYYEDEALNLLQQILFYRELEFPLKEIKDILSHPNYDEKKALQKQKELLQMKKERLEKLICLTEDRLKGEKSMNFQEFNQEKIKETKEKYAAEVKERWGKTEAYAESMKKADKYSEEDQAAINDQANGIFADFAALKNQPASSPAVQALVKSWQDHIRKYYYDCTKEILAGLGEMYAADERFAKNIDQAGEGTARFMREAIRIYCQVK